jgi:hypothetical protein
MSLSHHDVAPRVLRRRRFPVRSAARPALALAALAVLFGCFATLPLDDRAGAGTPVQVTLTQRGTTEMASMIGPGVTRADGLLARLTADTLEISLVRTEIADGSDNLWRRQRVAFPRALVSSTTQRRLSRTRTWLLAGTGVVAAIVVGAGFAHAGEQGGVGGGTTVPH